MRLLVFSARIDFAEVLPRTKHNASITFDLPEPFGPMTTLKSLVNKSSVRFPKLLNPSMMSLLIFVAPIGAGNARELGCGSVADGKAPATVGMLVGIATSPFSTSFSDISGEI